MAPLDASLTPWDFIKVKLDLFELQFSTCVFCCVALHMAMLII